MIASNEFESENWFRFALLLLCFALRLGLPRVAFVALSCIPCCLVCCLLACRVCCCWLVGLLCCCWLLAVVVDFTRLLYLHGWGTERNDCWTRLSDNDWRTLAKCVGFLAKPANAADNDASSLLAATSQSPSTAAAVACCQRRSNTSGTSSSNSSAISSSNGSN